MTRALVAAVLALALAPSAMAIPPGDDTEVLNDVPVTWASGLASPGSAWRVVRYIRTHEPPQAKIDSLTLYASTVDLAFAHPELRITPLGADAIRPAWLVRISNIKLCSIRYAQNCWIGTAWLVLNDPSLRTIFGGWP